jgi:hypothetical protein
MTDSLSTLMNLLKALQGKPALGRGLLLGSTEADLLLDHEKVLRNATQLARTLSVRRQSMQVAQEIQALFDDRPTLGTIDVTIWEDDEDSTVYFEGDLDTPGEEGCFFRLKSGEMVDPETEKVLHGKIVMLFDNYGSNPFFHTLFSGTTSDITLSFDTIAQCIEQAYNTALAMHGEAKDIWLRDRASLDQVALGERLPEAAAGIHDEDTARLSKSRL